MSSSDRARKIFKSFGFDDFMVGQMLARFEHEGMIVLERDRIHHQGTQPLNGNDAYSVLGIVFDWIEESEAGTPLLEAPTGNVHKLLDELRRAGYCCCTTEFGCAACGGKRGGSNDNQETKA
jgi:hypothetical protein